ncbi:MAG: RnfABCDGE type electron transport complex subunit D [Bacteroidales bacterium]|nr:RnfABCDGE type electron transport complex subunit D [Bacteroidales bacterium]
MRKLIVSPSPHIHSKDSTRSLMADVLIALSPAMLVSVFFYGLQAIQMVLVGAVTCVAVEWLIQKYLQKVKPTINDLSAAVTGVLLALNLPPNSPWWLTIVGSIVAIGVAKLTFGGLGHNIFNPALVGRVFLLISFPVLMTDWSIPASWFINSTDAVTGATPLAAINEGLASGLSVKDILAQNPGLSYSNILFARAGGSVGEISGLALMLGFIYLLVRRVIRPHITISIWLTIAVVTGIFWLINPDVYTGPVFNLLTGGVLLGSIFMATDYVTSPMAAKGQIIYGIGIGLITVMIRYWGSYPEGVSFAILIMNAFTPLINKYIHPTRFGKEVRNG